MPDDEPNQDSSEDEGTEPNRVERQRERLLAAVSSARTRTVQEKVAWILSRDRRARDSDLYLMFEYWKEFHGDVYSGGAVAPDVMYRLPRQITLTRARAKIQNTYRLFVASPEVQATRRSLSEDTRRQMAEDQPESPLITVAADESGKQGRFLIVGSVWALTAEELRATMIAARDFKKSRGFKWELHFAELNARKLQTFLDFVDEVIRPAPALSFRAMSVQRAGLDVDAALKQLFTHLVLRGVEIEDSTGRAPLPRSLTFWKDRENQAQDSLFLADMKQRLIDASAGRFNNRLRLEEFSPIDSSGSEMVQIADLFTSSLNRLLNGTKGEGTHAKDRFAELFLDAVHLPRGPEDAERVGDMTALIAL